MASVDHGVAHVHKGQGLVPAVFNEDNLSTLKGEFAIGHTRYSTTGGTGLRNAQPHVIETIDGPLGIAHNGNLVKRAHPSAPTPGAGRGTADLVGHRGDDSSAHRRFRRLDEPDQDAHGPGRRSLRPDDHHRDAVYGVRDPWGFRPLVLGKFEGGYLLASETCAFSAIGAELVHELAPGEICRLDADGYRIEQGAVPKQHAFCTFEQIYFSRPDSIYEGKLVHSTRQRLGRELAREAPVDADVVVAVPDSGTRTPSDSPRKRASRTPRDSPRTAMSGARSSSPPRSFASRSPNEVQPARRQPRRQARGHGRRFDRAGHDLWPLVQMLRDAGASEVHVRVACPAITDPCYMGVDMAAREDLIAANMDVESIAEHIGADSLAFLSIEALMRGLEAQEGYCNACFTGVYPFEEERFVQLTLKTKEQFASVWGD